MYYSKNYHRILLLFVFLFISLNLYAKDLICFWAYDNGLKDRFDTPNPILMTPANDKDEFTSFCYGVTHCKNSDGRYSAHTVACPAMKKDDSYFCPDALECLQAVEPRFE